MFEEETGILIDPQYEGRDILHEAIPGRKPNGITVVPWFAYGIVGGVERSRLCGVLEESDGGEPVFDCGRNTLIFFYRARESGGVGLFTFG